MQKHNDLYVRWLDDWQKKLNGKLQNKNESKISLQKMGNNHGNVDCFVGNERLELEDFFVIVLGCIERLCWVESVC